MRKIVFTLLATLVATMVAWGAPIDSLTAKKVATNAYKAAGINGQNFRLFKTFNDDNGNALVYLLNDIDGQGFAIISADDRIEPVLAYGKDGNFMHNKLPYSVSKWIDGYQWAVKNAIEKNVKTLEVTKLWEFYTSNSTSPDNSVLGVQAVSPLLTTKWNQSPYYNDLCPYDNTQGERTVTGCVATAMAQVIKYHNYPAQGQGYHSYASNYGTLSANFGATTYNYGSMPNTVSSSNSAVATLMYHCGVSVEMGYGVASTGGSSAYVISSASASTHCMEYALKTYFKYATTLQGVKKTDYSATAWTNLLKAELDASRPLPYAGFGQGGHAFVCDGYDNSNLFHFNWGWGGYLDGYYSLTNLTPGTGGTGAGSGSYTDNQQAIIGVKPAVAQPNTSTLSLNSAITYSPATVLVGGNITVSLNIKNTSTANFTGSYCVAIFNSGGSFVKYVAIKNSQSLQAGYTYTNNLSFYSDSLPTLAGNYKLYAYYKPTGQTNWILLNNVGSYSNGVNWTLSAPTQTIKLYKAIKVANTDSVFTVNEPKDVTFNIQNTSASTFNGTISIDLHKYDGTGMKVIKEFTNVSLPSNYVFTADLLAPAVSISEIGSYLLAVWYKPNGGSWKVVEANTNMPNPKPIIVVPKAIIPDVYEPNNSITSPYVVTPSFTGNTYAANFVANLHNGADVDFYKLNLPTGYMYSIDMRAHDSYNSGDGNTYTADVVWAAFHNNVAVTSPIDDIPASAILLNNGGSFTFSVASYFSGITGTYKIQVNATQLGVSSVAGKSLGLPIQIYPNPANDVVHLHLLQNAVKQVSVTDMLGRKKNFEMVDQDRDVSLDISGFSKGILFIQVEYLDGKFSTEKLIKR